MRTRRTVALGLSAVMAVSVLSGCGSSSSNTAADTKGESNTSAEGSTEPVVLHWWGSFAENMGPEQVCEAFNKIDPNLQVEYTRYVNDDAGNTKLDMTLMSDDSIDVFLNMNDVLLMKRIENGYMYPLDELFEGAGFSLEDDYDETLNRRRSMVIITAFRQNVSPPPSFTTSRCLMMQGFLIQAMTGPTMSL